MTDNDVAAALEPDRAHSSEGGKPPGREQSSGVGIALSGGGLRAASFSLGALQALDDEYGLLRGDTAARYIAAVSGGSYIAGALALVNAGPYARYCAEPAAKRSRRRTADAPADAAPEAVDEGDPHRAFRASLDTRRVVSGLNSVGDEVPAVAADSPRPLSQGSPEVNWILRHSRYLIDDGAWTQAFVVLGFFFFSAVPLLAAVVLSAIAATSIVGEIATLYNIIGVPGLSIGNVLAPLHESVWVAAALDVTYLVAGALLVRNAFRLLHTWRVRKLLGQEALVEGSDHLPDIPRTTRFERVWAVVFLVVGLILILGSVVGVYDAILGVVPDPASTEISAASVLPFLAIAGIVLAAILLLYGIGAWTRLAALRTLARLTLGALVFVIPWALLAVLFAWVLAWADQWMCGGAWIVQLVNGTCPSTGALPRLLDALLSVGFLVLTGLALWAGLALLNWYSAIPGSAHNVYARLVAKCFAVIRTTGGAAAADFRRSDVALSSLGNEAREPGAPRVPELRICAAANVSDRGTTLAGAAALPLVFSPTTVRIPTDESAVLDVRNFEHARSSSVVSSPIGLASAIAISGAAISPAMGRHTLPQFRALMAMLGLRIGRWVPNPSSPAARRSDREKSLPLPEPDLRHLGMEMLGLHQSTRYSVYASDGGHFENMGFVELLRERCTEIWLVDASPNTSGYPLSLTQSIILAEAEAGCDITIEMDEFGQRDSRGFALSTIATGEIRYRPRQSGQPHERGRLHVIRLGVTAKHSSIVKNYVRLDRGYPFHPTIQQIYTADRVEAYRRLGWESMRFLIDVVEDRSPARSDAATAAELALLGAPLD